MNPRRTPEDGWKAVGASLRTLRLLAAGYDAGDCEIAREIATIVHRLVTDELTLTGSRRAIAFFSLALGSNPKNLLPQDLITFHDVRVQYAPGDVAPKFTVRFHPVFIEQLPSVDRRVLKFNDWWNAPIFISGAARDGQFIPVDAKDHVPFDKRTRLTRFQIVKAFRNKVGAHYDHNVDEEAKSLEDTLLRIGVGVNIAGLGSFSDLQSPELFTFANTRAQASMRHLAFELLEASKGWPKAAPAL